MSWRRQESSTADTSRISSLPDGVLCHILSFLPTKQSVATSILSKRWSPLWRSVPVLFLSDNYVTTQRSFSPYSNRVLSLLNQIQPPIKKLTLKSQYHDTRTSIIHINKWIDVVLERGEVEYLELQIRVDYVTEDVIYGDAGPRFPKLPISILGCGTLVVLKLFGVRFSNVKSVELPSLKIVHLNNVYFALDRCLRVLLSGCPNLEEFKSSHVKSGSEYIIEGLNIWEGFDFKSLSKLIRVDIFKSNIDLPLEAVYNVKYLNLNVDEVCHKHKHKHIPAFHNLTHVKLVFDHYRLQWLIEVLKHCPMLQILEVHEKNWNRGNEDLVDLNFVPECISLNLRECHIRVFVGKKGGFEFARYIMQNASVLQTMRVYVMKWRSTSSERLEMMNTLSLCEKRSAACEISLIESA